MAIDYASVTIHSRAKGHSAVAAAAYRSAERLFDERYGKEYNYENKENVVYSCIILPEGADEKFRNRQYLWNEVEKAEIKSNSRVCKDIVLALPKELNQQEWIELSKRFTEEQFTSRGIAADIAIHENKENPHCHILVTTRRLVGDKFTEKARDLDGMLRHSSFGNFSSQNSTYNTDWKNLQNKYFDEKNLNIRVDQNYIIPQVHTGSAASDEEKYLNEINRIKYEQSRQIALNNPDAVLALLTMRETVFSQYDIESIAYKHSNDLHEYNQILNNILNNEKLVILGKGQDGIERYTTKYAIHQEYKLDRYAKVISIRDTNCVPSWKTDLFIKQKSLSIEQVKAVKHITEARDLAIVIGKPGTGKTYMLNTAKEIWNHDGHKVYGATVSGIASDNLQKETGIASRTIASWDRLFDNGFKFTKKDVLVVDEAGMVNLYQMKILFEQAKNSGAKIILVGDPDQLNPIGPGAPLRLMAGQFGYSEMTDIRRQKINWQRDITYNLALGDINAVDVYKDRGNLVMLSVPENAKRELIEQWSRGITSDNISNSIIMAHRNADVYDLNIMARSELINTGILKGEESIIKTNNGNLKILSGERILFTRNDKDSMVKNGNFATVISTNGNTLEVMIDKRETPVSIDLKKYDNISYGYAATVHKLQGVTIDKSFVYYGGKYWNKNLNLVALSRHRDDIKIFADTRTHKNYDILKQRLNRAEFKDSVLNYPVAFSLRYGVDPDSVMGKVLNKFNEVIEKVQDTWLWLSNKQSYLERHPEKEETIKFELNENTKKLLDEYAENQKETVKMQKDKTDAQIDLKPYKVELIDKVLTALDNNEKRIIDNLVSSQDGFFAKIKESLNNSHGWPYSAITKDQAQSLVKAYENMLTNKAQHQSMPGQSMDKSQEISIKKDIGISY